MTITAETVTTTEGRARAHAFLTTVIGSPPDNLCWDEVHPLQGHTRVDGQELVVIATRDELHRPVVLVAADWDEIRRNAQNRRTILEDAGDRRSRAPDIRLGRRSVPARVGLRRRTVARRVTTTDPLLPPTVLLIGDFWRFGSSATTWQEPTRASVRWWCWCRTAARSSSGRSVTRFGATSHWSTSS